jgi:ribA/ribD-fused uncharacterized protein
MNNLIFDGLKPKTKDRPTQNNGKRESPSECVEVVYDLLETKLLMFDARDKIKIERAHRIGPVKTGKRGAVTRPMIVKFLSYSDRNEVWYNRFELKSTGVWLREDFPNEISLQREMLKPVFNKALQLDQSPKLEYNRLHVGKNTFTVKSLDTLPLELSYEKIFCKQSDFMCFQGLGHPLSNFYMCSLDIDGYTFSSTEQYFQFRRAECCKRRDVAEEILVTDDPRAIINIGKGVTGVFDEWERLKDTVMETALHAKFNQHEHLKAFMLGTGTRRLIHTNAFDSYWAVGLPASDPNIADQSEWKGQNRLGELLTAVRDKLV